MNVLHPATTGHFVNAQCCCHRGIQAGGDATQWDPNQMITVATGEQRKALALGTGHQDQRPLQVHVKQCRIPF